MVQQIDIYWLDLVSTTIFALYGAFVALERKVSARFVVLAGFATAVGGGTVRSLITHTPLFYFTDDLYFAASVLGIVLSMPLYQYFNKKRHYLEILDALGFFCFSYVGASIAQEHHLGAWGVLAFAPLTATGGGVLRDIFLLHKMPNFVYPIPAILFGCLYLCFFPLMNQAFAVYALLFFCFLLRVIMLIVKAKPFITAYLFLLILVKITEPLENVKENRLMLFEQRNMDPLSNRSPLHNKHISYPR